MTAAMCRLQTVEIWRLSDMSDNRRHELKMGSSWVSWLVVGKLAALGRVDCLAILENLCVR